MSRCWHVRWAVLLLAICALGGWSAGAQFARPRDTGADVEAATADDLEDMMRRRRSGFADFSKTTADLLTEEGLTVEELEREKAAQAQMRVAQVQVPEDLLLLYDWSLLFRFAIRNIWVERDLVLVLTRDNGLYAVNRLDGNILWKIVLQGRAMYAPEVTREAVYVIVNNYIVAIDKVQGLVVWRRQPDFPVSSSPLVIEPLLYLPSWQGKMYAIESKRRERIYVKGKTEDTTYKAPEYDLAYRWHLNAKGMIVAPAVERDGMLYFGSEDGFMYSVTRDGELRYRFQTQGKIQASPGVASRSVYVGATDYNLYAVDRLTGEENWHFPAGGDIIAAPVVDAGSQMVYVRVEGRGIYALHAVTGREMWHLEEAEKIAGISSDRIYIFLSGRRLAAVEKKTGRVAWLSLLAGFEFGVQSTNDWTSPDDPMRVYIVNQANVLVSLKEQERLYRKREAEGAAPEEAAPAVE